MNPFEQLRVDDEPTAPDRRFVIALRHRIAAALDATGLPTVDLPERSPTGADTIPATTATPPPPATGGITPYLAVAGAGDAIDWYVAVLGAVEQLRYVGDDGRVGHAEIAIEGARLMLSDEYPELGVTGPATLGGTTSTIHVEVADVDAVHARVAADGRAAVGREPRDEAYGARSFDMVDPFGHRWMIQTPIAAPSVAEIQAEMPGFSITVAADTTDGGAPPVEVGYLTFATPDTSVASRFYGALFGWETEAGHLGDEYAHVGNTKLPMGMTPGPIDEAPVLYFRVRDIAAAVARVRDLGGLVVSEATFESGPNAVCRDDQGREFQLWQPAPGYE